MSRQLERLRKLEELAEAKRQSEAQKIDWSEVEAEILVKFEEFQKGHERGDPVKETGVPPTSEEVELLRKIATFAPEPDHKNEEQGS